MSEIDSVLKIAIAEIGYLEKASNSNLDDKKANAGNNNYTKYARDMDNLNVYNGIKQGYAWCNVFIDWIFVQALGLDRARQLLIGFSAGCTQDWYWLKNNNRIVSDPQKGDLIFFRNLSHIGIIEKVEGDIICTIEGNTSNAAELIMNGGEVARKVYNKNSSAIYGYARPNYNDIITNEPVEQPSNEIIYSLIKKGSKNNLVRIAQEKLIVKGYRLPKFGADGSFGSETEEAVRQLQKDAGINVDGIIGTQTWAVLNDNNFVKKNNPSYPGYYITKGQHNEEVRKIQSRLIELDYNVGKFGADSIFGNATLEAIKRFQRNNGLNPDGIVGEKTWAKLF